LFEINIYLKDKTEAADMEFTKNWFLVLISSTNYLNESSHTFEGIDL